MIIVTHNKKTMESADRMYGVTTREAGVSRRLRRAGRARDGDVGCLTRRQPAALFSLSDKTGAAELARVFTIVAW